MHDPEVILYSGLSRLLSYNQNTDKHHITKAQAVLLLNAEEADDTIKEVVQKIRKHFHNQVSLCFSSKHVCYDM